MAESYIYFLHERGTEEIKVGKSNNPFNRIQQLSEDIDIDISYCVECTEENVLKIEKALHRTFQQTRHWVDDRPETDGYTEWYTKEGVEKIKAYLEIAFDITEFIPLKDLPSQEERENLKKCNERNQDIIHALEIFLEQCMDTESIVIQEGNYLRIQGLGEDYMISGDDVLFLEKLTYTVPTDRGTYRTYTLIKSVQTHPNAYIIHNLNKTVKEEDKKANCLWEKISEIGEKLEALAFSEEGEVVKIIKEKQEKTAKITERIGELKTVCIELTQQETLLKELNEQWEKLALGTINKKEWEEYDYLNENEVLTIFTEDPKEPQKEPRVGIWRKELNEEGTIVGIEDYPFEDIGWGGLTRHLKIIKGMLNAIQPENRYTSKQASSFCSWCHY